MANAPVAALHSHHPHPYQLALSGTTFNSDAINVNVWSSQLGNVPSVFDNALDSAIPLITMLRISHATAERQHPGIGELNARRSSHGPVELRRANMGFDSGAPLLSNP